MIVRILNLWGIWPLTKLPRERKRLRERIVSVNIDIADMEAKSIQRRVKANTCTHRTGIYNV